MPFDENVQDEEIREEAIPAEEVAAEAPQEDVTAAVETPAEETPAEETPAEETPVAEPVPQESVTCECDCTPKKRKKGWTTGKVVALVLVACVFGSMLGLCGAFFGMQLLPENLAPGATTMYQGDRTPGQLTVENVNTGKLMTPAEIYAANVNATVAISTSITTNYWGYATTGAAAGSGFILTSDGYVATNYHIVEDANSVKVTLYNGQVYEAHLMGYNESRDIAILKINAEGLPTVVLGDSDNIQIGEQIMTVGNSLGELSFSLSVGYVSALDREIQFEDRSHKNLIQTDCAINAGNSGGAMFNAYGETVAIATGKFSGATTSGSYIDNIGFAVPINYIKAMLQQVVEKGYTSRPYVGITFMDVDERSQFYGIPKGASIGLVDKNSPAEKYGLKVYDVITEFNGQKVEGRDDLAEAVDGCEPNQTVQVVVYRSGETVELEITLGEKIVATEY